MIDRTGAGLKLICHDVSKARNALVEAFRRTAGLKRSIKCTVVKKRADGRELALRWKAEQRKL